MKMFNMFLVCLLSFVSVSSFAAKDDVWILDEDTDHHYFDNIRGFTDAIVVPVMNKEGIVSFDMNDYGVLTHRAREYSFGDNIYVGENTTVSSLGGVTYEGVYLEYVMVIDTFNKSRKAAPLGTKFFITPEMMGAFKKIDMKKALKRDGLKSLTPEKVQDLEDALK